MEVQQGSQGSQGSQGMDDATGSSATSATSATSVISRVDRPPARPLEWVQALTVTCIALSLQNTMMILIACPAMRAVLAVHVWASMLIVVGGVQWLCFRQ